MRTLENAFPFDRNDKTLIEQRQSFTANHKSFALIVHEKAISEVLHSVKTFSAENLMSRGSQ